MSQRYYLEGFRPPDGIQDVGSEGVAARAWGCSRWDMGT